MAASGDGKTVLTGGEDGKTKFWEAAIRNACRAHDRAGYPVYDLVLSPDSKTLLVALPQCKSLQLWDTTSGKPIGAPQPHPYSFSAGAFSRDGRTLATAGYQEFTARLWDCTTAKPIGLSLPHRDELISVAFSRDGKTS